MNQNRRTPILKVCKVDSLNFASFAIKQRVDFLGIHVLTEKNIGEHKELIEFIESNNGKAIIVTKIQDVALLEKLILIYHPTGIQFHFDTKPLLVTRIKMLFPDLILIGVITNQSEYLDFDSINKLYNYLIYDKTYYNFQSSVLNESNDYRLLAKFPKELQKKTLLAGGITVEKIKKLAFLNASGYDIQSYFRTDSGLNFRNLDKVCDILKFPRLNNLSISLTDIALTEIYQASLYYNKAHLEYHLDFSDGSLYSDFSTTKLSIEEKQQFLNQLPFSIHLFLKAEEEIKNNIKNLSRRYSLNLLRIFIQYFEGMDEKLFTSFEYNIKIIPSVFYKDLQSFIDKAIQVSVLSIVVPKVESVINKDSLIKTFIANRKYLENKEIWFDRNLDLLYIEFLKTRLGDGFNFIVGKEVINNWSKINLINEYLLK